MKQIKRICDFYAVTHRLKNTLRSGWQVWGMDAARLESVAEHIYGTQMLALAIHSEFGLKLDIVKVALMLAIHELGECIIGDIPATGRKITHEQKHAMEAEAVQKILGGLTSAARIMKLFGEFEEHKTPEAHFARLVDKLECDFQCKYYEETGCNDFGKPRSPECREKIKTFIENGYTIADAWINHDVECFFRDEDLFRQIADFVKNNKVFADADK